MLIAPLDWGLGHATRCIPLIEKMLIAGFKVIIAAEGDQKILLQTEFPELEIVHLNGYRLKYGATKWRTILQLIFQIPKILISINRENKWLRSFISNKHLDVIVADNRFGLRNSKIISVFITHQLHIKTSLGKFTDSIVQKMNYHFINQFDDCWVPDAPGATNLAGELSHPAKKPKNNVLYTGVLSRINKENTTITNKLLVLLSGPEPQRSILEYIILTQLKQYNYPAIIVRGLPAGSDINAPREGVIVYNHLPAIELQHVINKSEIIISRPGYSTLMDILPLGKKCIFIPTPGQGEQEYLATWITANNYACTVSQDDFSLTAMLEKVAKLPASDLSSVKNTARIEEAIAQLVLRLEQKKQ